MMVINLFGGPGSGKTTTAYQLVADLKKAGVRAELVGEAARELIYDHSNDAVPPALLDNQLYVAGLQYERLMRLARHGIEVAVADSPLVQGAAYAKSLSYYNELKTLLKNVEREQFTVFNVFVFRKPGTYDPESRVQRTEAEAASLDGDIYDLAKPVWWDFDWGMENDLLMDILWELNKDVEWEGEANDVAHETELS